MTRRILFLIASISIGAFAAGPTGIVKTVLDSLKKGDETQAVLDLKTYRAASGVTSEYLEAESWLARVDFKSGKYPEAARVAQDVYDLSVQELKKRPLDQDKHLPLALGASIEVQAGVMAAQNQRADAVSFLQEQLRTYAGTSIEARTQKNLLLLTLDGKPAPALDKATLPKGEPTLIFFWAHWCPDCKAEVPILKRIRTEFGPKGLAFVAPTQKYGYVAGGREAAPAEELAYIEQVRKQYYSGVIDAPAPVSEANFNRYGASTSPTIVVVDRKGIVRLYHPGAMTYEELQKAIEEVM